MREYGGPTTYSGILYQNSVAAIYFGQLMDMAACPFFSSVLGSEILSRSIANPLIVQLCTLVAQPVDWVLPKVFSLIPLLVGNAPVSTGVL